MPDQQFAMDRELGDVMKNEDTEITFQRDVLGRKEFYENLRNRILENYKIYKAPLSVSINGGYGTGKTWYLKMWKKQLEDDGYKAIYIDIWEDQIIDDPLLSFSYAILEKYKGNDDLKKAFVRVLKYSGEIVARTVASALESKTGIKIPCKKDVDTPFAQYEGYKKTIDEVKDIIKKKVTESGEDSPLFILVDELDRVRPPFALKILETMKHFFSIDGVIFIFGVNRNQLEESIRHAYGSKIDFEGYYKRFFKIEDEIPDIQYRKFVNFLNVEMERKNISLGYPSEANVRESRVSILAKLLGGFDFSLREMEHLYEMFSHFLARDKKKEGWHWACLDMAMFICSVYLKEKDIFNKMSRVLTLSPRNEEEIRQCEPVISSFVSEVLNKWPSDTFSYLMLTFIGSLNDNVLPHDRKEAIRKACPFLPSHKMANMNNSTAYYHGVHSFMIRVHEAIRTHKKFSEIG